MRISATNNYKSFGKTKLMECTIKNKETQNKYNASLYKMDIDDPNDVKDILYSKNAKAIHNDVRRESKSYPFHNFYLLQKDDNKEVLACAGTYRTFLEKNNINGMPGKEILGSATIISELSQNPKYVNAAEPLLAYIAKQAQENYDISISSAFRTDDFDLNNAKFSKTKNDNWKLPGKRFDILADQAEKRYQINWLG